MESRKIVLMNLCVRQQERHRHKEQTCGHSEGRKGRNRLGDKHGKRCITICKTDREWGVAVYLRELSLVLCDHLEGWDEGARFRARGHVYSDLAPVGAQWKPT